MAVLNVRTKATVLVLVVDPSGRLHFVVFNFNPYVDFLGLPF